MSVPLKLVVDTNVWLDYYLDRGPRHEAVGRVIAATAGERAAVYVTDGILKDFFFLFQQTLKEMHRSDGLVIDANLAASIEETAWACLRNIMHLALVVPLGAGEVWEAFALRPQHGDFEDNLIIAAAKRVDADYIVTADRQLGRRSPIPCLDVAEAASLEEVA